MKALRASSLVLMRTFCVGLGDAGGGALGGAILFFCFVWR